MKKITMIFLAAALALSLAGCSKNDTNNPSNSSNPSGSSNSSVNSVSSDSSSSSEAQSANIRPEVTSLMDDFEKLCNDYIDGTQLVVTTFISNCEEDANYLSDDTINALTDAMANIEAAFAEERDALIARGEALGDLSAEEEVYITTINTGFTETLNKFNADVLDILAEVINSE